MLQTVEFQGRTHFLFHSDNLRSKRMHKESFNFGFSKIFNHTGLKPRNLCLVSYENWTIKKAECQMLLNCAVEDFWESLGLQGD